MQELSLVFDAEGRVLGEVVTSAGAFSSVTLTTHGEDALGSSVKEWQVQGVPVMRDAISRNREGTTFQMFEDRIMTRDEGFLIALRAWMRGRGFLPLTLPERGMVAWEKLSALPLTDGERFNMIYAFCDLPKGDDVKWITAIEDAVIATKA